MATTLTAPPRLGRIALLGRLAVICVGIRIVLEAIGLTALAVDGQEVWANALELWSRWDAPHYLRLAEAGYRASSPPPNIDDQYFIVFFPFFPLAVHLVSIAVIDLVLSALIVSFAASVGAAYFLFRLVALDFDEATAWRAVILMFAFPTAYFMAAPFTESLYLFAVLAAVHSARTGSWAKAGLAGLLATGTRLTGVVLVPVFLVEILASPASWSERARKIAWISLSGVGLITYIAINRIVYGNPFQFLSVQREHWGNGPALPWEPITDAVRALSAGGLDSTFLLIYGGRIVGVLLAVPLLVLAIGRLRPADVVYGWLTLVLILSSAWLISLPRYLLVLYPLFILCARYTQARRAFLPLVATGVCLQTWLMWRYAIGAWTF